MDNVQTMAGGHVGHVRAIFSARGKRFTAPADLLRVQLRVANRLSAERHNAAVYARLAEDFGGYLVTDAEQAFSVRRDEHEYGVLPECVTGAASIGCNVVDFYDAAGGPIDAPELSPAGSMRRGDCGGFSDVVQRPGWFRAGGESLALDYAERFVEKCGRINDGYECTMPAGSKCPDCGQSCHQLGEGD